MIILEMWLCSNIRVKSIFYSGIYILTLSKWIITNVANLVHQKGETDLEDSIKELNRDDKPKSKKWVYILVFVGIIILGFGVHFGVELMHTKKQAKENEEQLYRLIAHAQSQRADEISSGMFSAKATYNFADFKTRYEHVQNKTVVLLDFVNLGLAAPELQKNEGWKDEMFKLTNEWTDLVIPLYYNRANPLTDSLTEDIKHGAIQARTQFIEDRYEEVYDKTFMQIVDVAKDVTKLGVQIVEEEKLLIKK